MSDDAPDTTRPRLWPRPAPLVLLLGSMALFVYSLVVRGGFPPAVDSSLFPNISLLMLVVGAAILTFRTSTHSLREVVRWSHPLALVAVPAILYVYTLALLSLGLVVSSVLLVAGGVVGLGERSPLRVALVALGFGAFAWLLIVRVLDVYLPDGLLF